MTAHPHAALMALYAQDAAETDKPWERWECRLKGEDWKGQNLYDHPIWQSCYEYRRKATTIRIGEFDVPERLLS